MKKIILIIPLLAISFLTNCKYEAGTCVVSFVANGGKILSQNPRIVEIGKHIKAPDLEERPGYNKDDVVWKDKDGDPFDFTTTVITNDIVLYADWGEIKTYHVTFYLNGQEYKKEDVEYNHKPHRLETPSAKFDNWYTDNTYSTPFDFDKELTGEECNINIYGRDRDEYSITIDGQHIEEQELTFLEEEEHEAILARINVEEDYALTDEIEVEPTDDYATVNIVDTKTIRITPLVNSSFNIHLKTEPVTPPEFYGVVTGGAHMTYYANEELTVELKYKKVKPNEDFVFYILAGDPNPYSNAEGYVPPTELDITINENPLDDYKIEGVSGAREDIERKVTIEGKYITGNIKIVADAVQVDCYEIACPYLFGMKQPKIEDVYWDRTQDATFEFVEDEDAQYDTELLTDENLYVNFTGGVDDWISPKYDANRFSEYASFEHKLPEDKYLLTIKANTIPTTTNIVKIVARTQTYPTLEKLSWGEIDAASKKGYAPSLFSIGDQKTVIIGEYSHSVRIVDFNRDDLADGKGKAGITFEFAHVIRGLVTCWNTYGFPDDDDNHDYTTSTLKDFCNDIYDKKMPSLLKAVIKDVKKDSRIRENNKWSDTYFTTKMFPLSYNEIGLGDSSKAYRYYSSGLPAPRKKNDKYWLRSPDEGTSDYAYYIESTGASNSSMAPDVLHPHAVAPGFCI